MDEFNPNAPPPPMGGESQEPATFSPNQPPPDIGPPSEAEQKLRLAHQHYLEHGDEYWGRDTAGYMAERTPGVNIAQTIWRYAGLRGALKGLQSGNPSDDDINQLAQYKAKQDYESQKSAAGQAVDMIGHVPGLVAEFAASGGIGTAARTAATEAAGRAGLNALGAKAAGYAAGLATQTALTPSLYVDKAVNNNIAADRDPLDPRGLPAAYGLAVAQMAVLGAVGKVTGKVFAGDGLGQAAGRVGIQAATGPFAQAATDVVTSFVGLDTGYGNAKRVLDGNYGEALQHAAMDALQFGAFGVAHEVVGGGHSKEVAKQTAEKIVDVLRAEKEKGSTPEEAAQALRSSVAPNMPGAPTGEPAETSDAFKAAFGVDLPGAVDVQPGNPSQIPADVLPGGPPPTAREVATGLENQLRAAQAQLIDAKRHEGKELTNKEMGLGNGHAEASEIRQELQKRVKTLQRQTDVARVAAASNEAAKMAGKGITSSDTPERPPEAPPANPSPEAAAKPVERRLNAAERKRVADMSPEERARELLSSQTVDLPNRRAFDEGPTSPVVGMSDADGLKAFNDKFGYEAGNSLLRAKAEALKAAGVDAYHEKGDEFLHKEQDPAALRAKLDKARTILKNSIIEVTLKDGTVKRYQGADFSFGVGHDLASAESGLKAHKEAREAAGERARGELRGITEATKGPDQVSEGGAPAQRSEAAGPTARLPGLTPEQLAARPWILRPPQGEPEPKQTLLQKIKARQAANKAKTPERAPQAPREAHDFTNYQPPTEHELAGLTKVESFAFDQGMAGKKPSEIVGDQGNNLGLNKKQAFEQAFLRASAKLGKIDPETGKPKSRTRLLAERSLENAGFNENGTARVPIAGNEEAVSNLIDDLAGEGTYLTPNEARERLRKSADFTFTKENAFQELWKEYFQEATKRGREFTPEEYARLNQLAADGKDPPANEGKKYKARQRKRLKAAAREQATEGSDTGGVREGTQQRPGDETAGGAADAGSVPGDATRQRPPTPAPGAAGSAEAGGIRNPTFAERAGLQPEELARLSPNERMRLAHKVTHPLEREALLAKARGQHTIIQAIRDTLPGGKGRIAIGNVAKDFGKELIGEILPKSWFAEKGSPLDELAEKFGMTEDALIDKLKATALVEMDAHIEREMQSDQMDHLRKTFYAEFFAQNPQATEEQAHAEYEKVSRGPLQVGQEDGSRGQNQEFAREAFEPTGAGASSAAGGGEPAATEPAGGGGGSGGVDDRPEWAKRMQDAPPGTQANLLPGSFGDLTGTQGELFDRTPEQKVTRPESMPGQTSFLAKAPDRAREVLKKGIDGLLAEMKIEQREDRYALVWRDVEGNTKTRLFSDHDSAGEAALARADDLLNKAEQVVAKRGPTGDVPFSDQFRREPGRGQSITGPSLIDSQTPVGNSFRRALQDFAADEAGSLDLDKVKEFGGYAKDRFVAGVKGAWLGARSFGHEMFPVTGELSPELQDKMATLATSRTHSNRAKPYYIDKVLGEHVTDEQSHLWMTTLQESRLRYARADAASRGDAEAEQRARRTFIGVNKSALPDEATYQATLKDPEFLQAVQRYKEDFVPVIEEYYKQATGMDQADSIDALTQIPGLPVPFKAIREGEKGGTELGQAGSGSLSDKGPLSSARGSLNAQKLRKLGASREAKFSAETYETDFREVIAHILDTRIETANKHEMFRTAVAFERAHWDFKGPERKTMGDGVVRRLMPNVEPPKGTQENKAGQNSLYVDEAIWHDMKNSLNMNEPGPGTKMVRKATNVLNAANLFVSTGEILSHGTNQVTMFLTKPGMRYSDLFSNIRSAYEGKPEFKKKMMDLARDAMDKPSYGLEGERSLLKAGSRLLDGLSDVMRATASDAYDRLAAQRIDGKPLFEDTKAAKRNFVNQLGQYERRSQNGAMRWLRDSGVGPFATAGTNYIEQSIGALSLNPGVKGEGVYSKLYLRANFLKNLGIAAGTVMALNYALWGRLDGDDRTPWGNIKIGQSGGKTHSIDVSAPFLIKRGLRTTGLLSMLEGQRGAMPAASAFDKGTDDIMHAFLHPSMGPAAQFALEAATGKNTIGMQVAEKAKEGQSQKLLNMKAAALNANPIVAAATGTARPSDQRTIGERSLDLLGPFAPKVRQKAVGSK